MSNNYFIYLFREKETNTVIYVGSTRQITERLNEHRRAFRDKSHELPIHRYMRNNNLKLFEDVEVSIVAYLENVSKEEALKVEALYFYKYKDTLKNTRPAEVRTDEYSPRSKAVKCINDNKCFVSIRRASEYYGLNRNTIMSHLNKGTVLKNGLVFRYLDSNNKQVATIYRIYCVEDSKYFTTIKSCADFYGVRQNMIYSLLRYNKEECFFNGKHFRRCNDYSERKYTQVSGNGETPNKECDIV